MADNNSVDKLNSRFQSIFERAYCNLPDAFEPIYISSALDRREIEGWKFKYGWLP